MANLTEVIASRISNEDGAPSGAPSSPRKRGRPKGSKNRPKDENGNPVDTGPIPTNGDSTKFNYVADPAGIAAAGKMFSTIWYLVGPLLKVRPLTEVEEQKTGEALDPVLQKYVPMYNDWKYEINLMMIVIGLYQICREDWDKEHKEEKTESKAEVIE